MPLDTACITQHTADIAALLDALEVANINLQRKDNAQKVLAGEIRILLAEVASLTEDTEPSPIVGRYCSKCGSLMHRLTEEPIECLFCYRKPKVKRAQYMVEDNHERPFTTKHWYKDDLDFRADYATFIFARITRLEEREFDE
jgi:hypothetical protein